MTKTTKQVPAPRLRFPGFEGEWGEKALGEIAMMSSGGTPSSSVTEYYGGDIPWVSISDMTKSGKYLSKTERNLTLLGLNNSSARIFPEETILFAMYASIGKCNISSLPVSTSQAILGIIPTEEASVEYIYYFLAGNEEKYADMGQHGTQKNLNAGMVKALPIPLPPTLPEQTRIAAALSSLDAVIAAHQSRQDALREHKRGLMAGLFPAEGERLPRLRFPEFEGAGEWEEKKLGEVAPLQRGHDLPSSQLVAGDVPVVYSNGIQNHHNTAMAQAPALITGRSGTIGKLHYIESGPYWPHNTTLWVTSFTGNNPKFVYYLYGFIDFTRFASGSGVPTLNRNDAHAFITSIPSLPEQTRIAACLSSLDSLIAAQGDHIAALQAFKRGLMQGLFPAAAAGPSTPPETSE